jgi:hypothetical protein
MKRFRFAPLPYTKTQPHNMDSKPAPATNTFGKRTTDNTDMGGTSEINGLTIRWRAADTPFENARGTVSVHEVLQAAASRLSSIQRTAQATDINARALWHVTNAIDQLAGIVPAEDVSKFLKELPE